MKYYIIAGEVSGDLHASNLMKGLKAADAGADFRVWGGDLMEAQGGVLVKHIRDLSFMGIWEVVKNFRVIMDNISLCQKDIMAFAPDVVLLVDFPGFNLKIARFAHGAGIKTFYYISPKIWAWQEKRVHTIKKFVDRMFVIFPFEVEFFRKHNYEVFFEGNPLIDAVEAYKGTSDSRQEFLNRNELPDKPIIALIAGSRRQELKWILPEMMQVVERFPDYQFVLSGVSTIDEEYYRELMDDMQVPLIFGETYALMQHAQAALVTSGTATLETALFGTPQVVVYKTSPVTYAIGKPFVTIPFFSLVNIIMGREVVKELLQYHLADGMERELNRILHEPEFRAGMLRDYTTIRQSLGEPGVSYRVAQRMVSLLQQ